MLTSLILILIKNVYTLHALSFASLYIFIGLSSLLSLVFFIILQRILCFVNGLLCAMLFIFLLPFRASDCVHNFLPIFIVCLAVYFAVHNLCLGFSFSFDISLSLSQMLLACAEQLPEFSAPTPPVVGWLLLRSFVISLVSPFFCASCA